jgi:smad nuclear-interacting protein 1
MEPSPTTKKVSSATSTITDNDTIQALLAEAEATREKDPTQTRNQSTKERGTIIGGGGTARQIHSNKRPRDDYYGDQSDKKVIVDETATEIEKKKPDFGLSGALLGDTSGKGGTIYKGVVLKFQEPLEARTPNTQWRLYVFKDDKQIDTLHIAKQSAYLIGRNEDVVDIHVAHPSLSSQHAVIQYRALPNKETGKLSCQPYLLDLESTNGSFINGVRIDSARYYQLKKGDILKFGASTREYVLLAA